MPLSFRPSCNVAIRYNQTTRLLDTLSKVYNVSMDPNALSPLLAKCPCPDSLQHVDRGILGPGFYPGAQGFLPSTPCTSGIMLLGRVFGTKQYHEQLCGTPAREETAITWRHTRDIYLAALAGLPVWCTHYFIGLRRSGSLKGNIAKRTSAN